MFAFEKLQGLPRQRLVDAVEPVLRAHGVSGVELLWRMDGQGRVLEVTVEPEGAEDPRACVTLDQCAQVSRDLSTALDVSEVLPGRYHLMVGSPGLERGLYRLADYQRFRGHSAKLKLSEPLAGQSVVVVRLLGVTDDGKVQVRLSDPTEHPGVRGRGGRGPSTSDRSMGDAAPGSAARTHEIPFEHVKSGHLRFEGAGQGASEDRGPREAAGHSMSSKGRR